LVGESAGSPMRLHARLPGAADRVFICLTDVAQTPLRIALETA